MTSAEGFLTIKDATQLRSLQHRRFRHSQISVALDLPGLSSSELRVASERITSDLHECGCSLGTKFMAIGFGISVLYVALVSGIWTWEFLWRLPWTVLCAFGGAAVGKWFGLVTARIRLHREIDMLVAFQATLPALKV